MMYNDVDNDLPPFNDTIDGEEIFLFSNTKSSSTGASFLHDDDDDHLRHQHNGVAGTSAHHHHHHHLPVDVDELLLNSNFLEQPSCDQSEDPLFWNCKDISDDQLNEFLPQAQLHLNGNSIDNNCVNPANTTTTTNTIATTNFATNVSNTQQNRLVISQQPTQNISQLQHSQTIIPVHQLQQSQQEIQQQQQQQQQQQLQLITPQILNQSQPIHHQQIRLQQQQPDQLNQLQQTVTSLQNQAHNLQPTITIQQQSGFQAPQQIIQHVDQYHSKWITLVQTNEQYQTYTTPSSIQQTQQPQHQQIQQFFDKIPQSVIQSDAGSSALHNQLGAVISASTQPLIIQQPQAQNLQQAQLQLQLQQQQAESQHQQQQQQQQQLPQSQQLQHQQVVVNQPTQQVQTPQPPVHPYEEPAPAKPERSISQDDDSSKKEVSTTKLCKSKDKQTRLDCPFCKRSFSKNFDLQQHMRCHTGEKPFQCIVCGRGFAQKSNVKKHMQAHKVWPEGPNNPPMPSNHTTSRSRNNSASSSLGTPRDDECMQENDSIHINDNNNNINNNTGTALGPSNDRKNDGNDIFAENRYSCSYCQFNGRTYFELKSHLTIHKREKVFKCIVSSCGKTFSGSDLQGFLDHVTGHKDLIYHCHLCSGQFYSLDEFGEHQKHHSSTQSKRTSQSQSLSNSNVQTQVNVSNQRQNNNTSLRQQNQQVTPTQLQPQQNQRQYNQQQITATQQQSNNQKQNNNNTTTTTATTTSTTTTNNTSNTNGNNTKLFTNNSNNSRPTNNKNNSQKFFRCSKCMNRYTTQTALDHHLSISTHNFPCTECNKVFMCERYLRRHLNTHTAVQHVCSFCDKHFKTAAYLKMHSVVHTGEKPFRCNQCEAAFNRRDKLNRHKLTHETIKKFKCPFKPHIGCTKEFNRPDKLKAHVLTHSGVRPHPCDSCSRTFSRLSRLREHKKLHHGNNNSGNNNNSNSLSNKSTATTPNLSTGVTFVGPTKHQHVQTSIAPQQLNLSVVIGVDNVGKMNGATSVVMVKKE